MNNPLAPRFRVHFPERLRPAGVFVVLLLAQAFTFSLPAQASVITVAPSAVTGSSAGCSLTDAVLAANASTDATVGNVTVGACTPTGTPGGGGNGYGSGNVIELAAGSYTFTAPDNYWYGPNALPPIASNIVIVGNSTGSFIERSTASGTPAFRLFYVGGGESLASYNAGNVASGKLPGPGQLTLVNLTVENGLAKGGDSLYGGGGLGAGGAIYNQGTLALTGVTLSGNEALGGSTLTGGIGGGGGIGATAAGGYTRGGGFTTALWPSSSAASGTFGNGGGDGSSCFTSGCTAGNGQIGGVGGGGGGGGNDGSPSSNGTPGDGGAGGFGGGGGEGGGGNGTATSGSGGPGGFGGGGGGNGTAIGSISSGGFGGGSNNGNVYGGGGAGFGGAVFNEGGTVTTLNSTLSSNTADGGYGYGDGGDGYGGALFNLNGAVTLRYTTLADNAVIGGTASSGGPGLAAGGAIYNLYLASPGSPAADAVSSATMTVNSSILSGTTNASGTSETDCENNAGTFTSGYDVVQTAGSCTFNNNDQTANPQLATSAATANGGPTPTLALTSTSPAINASDTGTTLGPVPTVDQRGYGRNTKPDVGAYEYIFAPTVSGLPATLTVTLGSNVPQQSFSLDGSPPLTVTAASSNATLLPASGITLSSGCGSDTSHYACTLSLTPTSNQTGTTTVTVKAADTHANTGQQSMNLTVKAVPAVSLSPAPLAFGSVTAGSSKTLPEVLTNTGTASLSISSISIGGTNAARFTQSNPCGSSLGVGATCTILVTYTPNALTTDNATLIVASNAPTSPDSVLLTGTGTDTAPTAYNGTLSTSTDTAANGTLSATNPNSGQTLTFSIVTPPSHGTVTITNANSGAYTYTPATGYAGSDSFTFRANDGYLDSNTATVSIMVTDTPPTAIGASFSTPTNQALTGQLQGNANDVGQTLTFSLAQAPAHGKVTVNANGSFKYMPNSGYAGSDAFTFTVNDGYLNSARATVSVTVNDTAPMASNASFSTPLNTAYPGQLQASNPDSGQTLTYSIVTQPSHGTVSITNASTGAYTYTPTSGYVGSDSFTFKANDGYLDSNTATVSASVTDNPPVAQSASYNVTANRYVSGHLKATASSSSQTLTYAIVSKPADGTVSLDANTGQFTYIPTHNYTGTDSFTFKANDGTLDSNTATITLKVAAGSLAQRGGAGGGAIGPWGLALLAGMVVLIALLRRKPHGRGSHRECNTGVARASALALGLVLAGSALFTALPARAAGTGPWYGGIQGNVIKPAGGRNSATAGFKGWTLLFGRHLGKHFALEIDRASYSDNPETLTATANWVNWGLRGLYFPWKSQGAFAPFFLAGAGHQYEYRGDNSELSNNSASLGLGFTSQPWSAPVAIRADIEAQHGFGSGYTDRILSLGIVFGFGIAH